MNISFDPIPGHKPGYGNCAKCHEYKFLDPHHKLKRSQGGTDKHIVKLCRKCHEWVENHPFEAEKEGFHISAGISHGR